MSFTLEIKTPQEIDLEKLENHLKSAKREAQRRIYAVASAEAQKNISQAAIIYSTERLDGATKENALLSAGLLEGDLEIAKSFRSWVEDMRQTATSIGSNLNKNPKDDTEWPEVPSGVTELAERF